MTSSKRILLPAAAVLAIALIVVGCGGSGGDSSSDAGSTGEAAPLSKPAFIKQADAVCSNGKKEVEADFAAYLKKHKIEGIGTEGESKAEAEARKTEIVMTIGVPAYQKQVKEIDALATPAGDEATIEEFIDAAKKGVEEVEEEPEAVFDGSSKAFAKADKIAQGYGFKVCGNN